MCLDPRKFIKTAGLMMAVLIVLAVPAQVMAHVTVKPSEVKTGSFQTFTVNVPNERDIPVASLSLTIPLGVTDVMPNVKHGWIVTNNGTGKAGEDAGSLIWSGGSIPAGQRDEFEFNARTPDSPRVLHWKAVQTYQDGQTVSWSIAESDQPKKDDGSPDFVQSGPYSITKVANQTAQEQTIKGLEDQNSQLESKADRAIYLGAAGVLIGLSAIFAATRPSARK